MTRRDYLMLAEALKTSRPALVTKRKAERETLMAGWYAAVAGVADALAAQTDKFDRQMFMRNAGVLPQPK